MQQQLQLRIRLLQTEGRGFYFFGLEGKKLTDWILLETIVLTREESRLLDKIAAAETAAGKESDAASVLARLMSWHLRQEPEPIQP